MNITQEFFESENSKKETSANNQQPNFGLIQEVAMDPVLSQMQFNECQIKKG